MTLGRDRRNNEQLAPGRLKQKGGRKGKARLTLMPLRPVTVTENIAMPRGSKPQGEHALSNAERQARYRARHQAAAVKLLTRPGRPIDRRSRPQRWREAVEMLLALVREYTLG